jgi:hypothetical protein
VSEKISVQDGLKRKNRMAKRLKTSIKRMQAGNVYEDGETQKYDSREQFAQMLERAAALANVKAQLQYSNAAQKNFEDIMLLAELKGIVGAMEGMSCQEGRTRNHFRDEGEPAFIKTLVDITEDERDDLVEQLEDLIDKTERRLMNKNATTEVDLGDGLTIEIKLKGKDDSGE